LIKTQKEKNYDLLCQLLDDGETIERCQNSRKMIDIREILRATASEDIWKVEIKSAIERHNN
jgi:hypothetical protein